MGQAPLRRKCVVVGDSGCGKTCLFAKFCTGKFPDHYVQGFESWGTDVVLDDKLVQLSLWDTNCREEYDRLRPLSYPDVHVVLICFAVNKPSSCDNVLDKWISEVEHFCNGVPFILVGLKTDLRNDLRSSITYEQGVAIAQRIGTNYVECSAKLGTGVHEVFQRATRAAMSYRRKSSGDRCVII